MLCLVDYLFLALLEYCAVIVCALVDRAQTGSQSRSRPRERGATRARRKAEAVATAEQSDAHHGAA